MCIRDSSGLGQPLRAEIEINATRTELAGMSARLAPQKAFREAGIDYATALYDLRFAIDKRANGSAVLKITSVSYTHLDVYKRQMSASPARTIPIVRRIRISCSTNRAIKGLRY